MISKLSKLSAQKFQEMYENRSDSEHSDKDEQTKGSGLAPQRIGFNPFSLPFPSQPFSSVPGQFPPSLFAEMEVCEAYGDLSEEEENGEEGNCEEFQEKGEQHEENCEEFQGRMGQGVYERETNVENTSEMYDVNNQEEGLNSRDLIEEFDGEAVDKHSSGS